MKKFVKPLMLLATVAALAGCTGGKADKESPMMKVGYYTLSNRCYTNGFKIFDTIDSDLAFDKSFTYVETFREEVIRCGNYTVESMSSTITISYNVDEHVASFNYVCTALEANGLYTDEMVQSVTVFMGEDGNMYTLYDTMGAKYYIEVNSKDSLEQEATDREMELNDVINAEALLTVLNALDYTHILGEYLYSAVANNSHDDFVNFVNPFQDDEAIDFEEYLINETTTKVAIQDTTKNYDIGTAFGTGYSKIDVVFGDIYNINASMEITFEGTYYADGFLEEGYRMTNVNEYLAFEGTDVVAPDVSRVPFYNL